MPRPHLKLTSMRWLLRVPGPDQLPLRSVMPRTPFLLPGYGAQGGGAEGVRAALDPAGSGVLVTASRSIIRAWQSSDAGASSGESWTDAVSTAADRFIEEIAGVVDGSIA